MIFSNILSIIAPYFIAHSNKNLRGGMKPCLIEAECPSLHTCVYGKCHQFLQKADKYSGYPAGRTDIHDLYYNCVEDIELSEAFFYNSSPNHIRTYVSDIGIALLYTRKDKNAWKTITIDDWLKYKKGFTKRIDNIYDTDLLIAFCPIN